MRDLRWRHTDALIHDTAREASTPVDLGYITTVLYGTPVWHNESCAGVTVSRSQTTGEGGHGERGNSDARERLSLGM